MCSSIKIISKLISLSVELLIESQILITFTLMFYISPNMYQLKRHSTLVIKYLFQFDTLPLACQLTCFQERMVQRFRHASIVFRRPSCREFGLQRCSMLWREAQKSRSGERSQHTYMVATPAELPSGGLMSLPMVPQRYA